MKEHEEMNVLNNKLSKLMLRMSVLKQKSEEFKSKYGTRNAKLTATQLKAKESLKEKYKVNNAKIADKKAELKKMMRIMKKKGGPHHTKMFKSDGGLFDFSKNLVMIDEKLTEFTNKKILLVDEALDELEKNNKKNGEEIHELRIENDPEYKRYIEDKEKSRKKIEQLKKDWMRVSPKDFERALRQNQQRDRISGRKYG